MRWSCATSTESVTRTGDDQVTTASGEVLTDKDIEALADEAERGYDLDKAIRVTVGRPSLGTKGATPRVQVRVDPDLAKALRARARKERRSVSEIAVPRCASTSIERPDIRGQSATIRPHPAPSWAGSLFCRDGAQVKCVVAPDRSQSRPRPENP